jgi:hypothetical protein
MYVTHLELKEIAKKKLDCTVFRQFCDQSLARNDSEETQLEFDRQIHKLDRKFMDYSTTDEI